MIKKPEKKVFYSGMNNQTQDKAIGYNQTIEEYEAFLPTLEEIEKIIYNLHNTPTKDGELGKEYAINLVWGKKDLAKAIHKRQRGEG